MGTLGAVPFLLAGSFSSTPGWQIRAGTCSPGTTGFCMKFALGEDLPRRGSPGPGAESGLFLEVVPSSQHLLLSFPPRPGRGSGVKCPCPSPCPVPPRPRAVRRRSPHRVPALGLSLWGRHQEPKVCTSKRVALGPRLPPPVPVSPPQLCEIRLRGTCYQPRALVGSDAACIPQACLLGVCVCLGWVLWGREFEQPRGAAGRCGLGNRSPRTSYRVFPQLLLSPGSCWYPGAGGTGTVLRAARRYTCHPV